MSGFSRDTFSSILGGIDSAGDGGNLDFLPDWLRKSIGL